MSNYRTDIDGLRAIAVLAVVLYHAGVPWIGGGFVGVDVFFVISGFLITSITDGEIQSGKFSIAGFYERRVRRIFPALFFVIALTWIVAIRIYMPREFADYSASVAATAAFGTNILFWRQAGYFEGPSEIKPLLNVWSLAVEEQFYLGFPPMLYFLARLGRRMQLMGTILVLVASFGLAVWSVGHHPTFAFFLTPARAWELMLGALIALGAAPKLQSRVAAGVLSAVGLAMILFSCGWYSAKTPFPGLGALLPCLGAGLIIYSGEIPTHVGWLLSFPPLRFVGLISYSLYLIHWPALAFVRYYKIGLVPPWSRAAALVAALVLAVLSWRFIERPFRSRGFLSRRVLFQLAAVGLVVLGAAGLYGFLKDGLPGRFPGYRRMEFANKIPEYGTGTCFLQWDQTAADWKGDACFISRRGLPVTMLWGDSFSAHLVPGLKQNVNGLRFDWLQYSTASCAPVADKESTWRPGCREMAAHALDAMQRYHVRRVLLAAEWATESKYYRNFNEDLRRTVSLLEARRIEVMVLGQTPVFTFWDSLDAEYRLRLQNRETANFYSFLAFPTEFPEKFRRSLSGVTFINPLNVLCSPQTCPVSVEGQPLYIDGGHLSVKGSGVLIGAILKDLQTPIHSD